MRQLNDTLLDGMAVLVGDKTQGMGAAVAAAAVRNGSTSWSPAGGRTSVRSWRPTGTR
jgi:hypothetical protein